MINNWQIFKRRNNLQLETLGRKKIQLFIKNLKKQINFFEKVDHNDKQLARIQTKKQLAIGNIKKTKNKFTFHKKLQKTNRFFFENVDQHDKQLAQM